MTQKLHQDKQKLVDICFQIGLVIKDSKALQERSNEYVAAWIAQQLKECGFETRPCGMSWGVLED